MRNERTKIKTISSKHTFINTYGNKLKWCSVKKNPWTAFGFKEMKINILSHVKDQTVESSSIEEHGSHSCNSSS